MSGIAYELLVDQFRQRLCNESIPRLVTCVELLELESLNRKLNQNTLSVSQSIVHLIGNVRQWIFHHLLDEEIKRKRDAEFNFSSHSKEDLIQSLEKLSVDILNSTSAISKLAPNNTYIIQGMENTTVSVLVHVIEHFSYHTGQVAILTKFFADKDLGFYKDFDQLG